MSVRVTVMVALCSLAELSIVLHSAASESLRLTNKTGEPVTVWFQPEGAADWKRPPLKLAVGETAHVQLTKPGTTTVGIRLSSGSWQRLDWLPLYRAAELSNTPTLELGSLAETRTVTYSVNVPATEEIEQNYTVMVPVYETKIGDDGKEYRVKRMVPEQRTRTVKVTKTRSEERTREMEVRVPTLDVRVGEQLETLDGFTASRRLATIEERIQGKVPDDIIESSNVSARTDPQGAAKLNQYLRRVGLTSHVQFWTDHKGAEIWYEPVDDAARVQSPGTSDVDHDMDSGWYMVWAKRNGHSSRKQWHDIIRDKERVYVPEDDSR